MSNASRIVLVVGANGGIGSETALAFSRHGWKIRAFSRTKGSASGSSGCEWVKGDPLTGRPCSRRQKAYRPSFTP
jgi:NAD(P)-dependent dehydrogenase (short-subunit alcohol dehydrogenase family)